MLLSVVPVVAAADPLVVHTATPPNGRGVTTAQRVTLADAVAEVIASGQPEVVRASETHARVETLTPAALTCDAADCASSLLTTLHARGVVLVSIARARNQVTLTLRWIDAQGAVRNEQRAEEVVAGWDDAIALARVSARALLAAMPAAPPMPTPTVLPPTQTPAVVAPVVPPPAPATREVVTRRPVEAIVGGALVAGGAVALTIGSIAMAQDGTATGATVQNGNEVYVATTRDTVLVIAGAAAVAGGVFLLVDGLRARRTQERLSVRTLPLSGGGWVGVGGTF